MVLAANDAILLTSTSVAAHSGLDIQTEVSLAEASIRSATSFGLYSIPYNATTIGNPAVNPLRTDALTVTQQNFYYSFVNAGYRVGLDPKTGYWLISWEPSGAEQQVAIYSLRTIFEPTNVIADTTTIIVNYFAQLRPTVLTTIKYNGFMDETEFGAPQSVFFEFTIIANQGSDTTNHSVGLKTLLVTQAIGFTDDNCRIYQM